MSVFKKVAVQDHQRNTFDMSHELNMSMTMGKLTPMLCQEVIPGDVFKLTSSMLARFAPLISPVMHRVDIKTEFFFVPTRLIWEDYEEFFTGGKTGLETPVIPYLNITNTNKASFYEGSLADYLGIPPVPSTATVNGNKRVVSLPFRAYAKIHQDYYRDPNLGADYEIPTVSGEEPSGSVNSIIALRKRCYEKDYFTSCLGDTQRGSEMEIPVGSFTPEYRNYTDVTETIGGGDAEGNLHADSAHMQDASNNDVITKNLLDPQVVDGANTINELRIAARLQEWKELAMRAGYRYIEQVRAFFGVRSSDSRLQRPEYLGGGKQAMVISEVLNTSDTVNAAQGEMSGHGLSVGQGHGFSRSFEEHGYVIGLVTVIPRTGYQQGLQRMWSRLTKEDFLFPQFSQLGEQAVLNKEVYFDYTSVSDDENEDTFGYQSRYAEYKHQPSRTAGEMHTSLSHWNLNRIFDSRPGLNNTFMEVNSDDQERIFAVQDGSDNIYIQIYHKLKAMRKLPYFGVPKL